MRKIDPGMKERKAVVVMVEVMNELVEGIIEASHNIIFDLIVASPTASHPDMNTC